MQNRTLAIVLLAIAGIGVSQLPYTGQSTPAPCPVGQTCGFTATTTVLYWDGFPLYWFAELGLFIILIRSTGDIRYELRKLDQEEREEIPVASRAYGGSDRSPGFQPGAASRTVGPD